MFTKENLQFPKPYHIAKTEKYETSFVSKLLESIDTRQNKVSADQCHVTISRAKV